MMLNTDSKALNDFLFEGVSSDDTPLKETIDYLNDAILICAKLRVEMEFDNIENLRKELDKVSLLMVTTLNQMTGIHNDLKDLVAAHFAAKKNMKHD